LSARALEIAFSSKSYISINFGQANKKFYRKFFHLKSKIRTSKSGLRTEFGGPGSEINAKNTFLSFLGRKIKKFTRDFANNDASSTMLGGKFLTPNKLNW
jgi:hypothetical protein